MIKNRIYYTEENICQETTYNLSNIALLCYLVTLGSWSTEIFLNRKYYFQTQ